MIDPRGCDINARTFHSRWRFTHPRSMVASKCASPGALRRSVRLIYGLRRALPHTCVIHTAMPRTGDIPSPASQRDISVLPVVFGGANPTITDARGRSLVAAGAFPAAFLRQLAPSGGRTAGDVKDIDGRLINPEGLRFIGYLIADLTPSLRKHVSMRYHKMTDNEGYFSPLADGKGYVEIISYDKILNDAKRRNRVLFEKLGLHKD